MPATKLNGDGTRAEHAHRSDVAAGKPSPKRPRPAGLTYRQAEFLRRAWTFLADVPPGGDTDARLLAILCVVRAARTGSLNLVGADITGLRVADPHATVAALTMSGWLVAMPQAVLDADPAAPAKCVVPYFASTENPWSISNDTRKRASGWLSGVLAHQLLRKQSNPVRALALYLTTHANPDGQIEFDPDHAIAACALASRPAAAAALKDLIASGWLTSVRTTETGYLRAQLADPVAPLAPRPPAPEPTPTTTWDAIKPAGRSSGRWGKPARPVRIAEIAELIEGREVELVAWVARYRAVHEHGPTWLTFCVEQGWPVEDGRPAAVSQRAMSTLYATGWLTGKSEPYGMRPAPGSQSSLPATATANSGAGT